MSDHELTYRVNPLEMTSVSCTRRRALRDSPVSVLPLWTKLWSRVAWAWTALCMQPCLHSVTPLRPTQPSRARPHGAAARDHRPPDVVQRPSSTAAKPISPAMSLVRGDTGGTLDYYTHSVKTEAVYFFMRKVMVMSHNAHIILCCSLFCPQCSSMHFFPRNIPQGGPGYEAWSGQGACSARGARWRLV